MKVREQDLLEVDEPDRGRQQLALRALTAVDEQPFAAPPDEERRGAAEAVGIEPDVPRKTRSRSTERF